MFKRKELNRVFRYTPMAITVSLIIIIMSFSIVLQERNDVYQVAKQSVLNNAKLIGKDSEDVFIDAYKFLGSIGTYYENDILKEHKSLESFEQLVSKQIKYYPIIHHVTTVDKDGNVISSTSLEQNKSGNIANLKDRKYFQEAKEDKKEIIIYGPVQSIITGEWIVLIAKRLENSDKSFAGILVAAININTFVQMYKKMDLDSNGVINLRKNDLSQVARYPELNGKDKGPGNKNISNTLADILKDNPNLQEINYEAISPLDEKNKIFGIYKLDKINMFISVGRSTDDFGTTWKTTGWFLGIFAIFLSIVIIVVARKLDEQSEKLQEIVQEKVNALEIINRLREDFIEETKPFEQYHNLRDNLVKITNSKEVFIGEISYNEINNPLFKIFSLTDSSWNEKITQYSEENKNEWFEFIITNKEVFISNNSQYNQKVKEFLKDDFILNSLMVIPVIFGEKIVGIVGFVNKPQGYNKIDAEELNDILLALGQVMVARQDREQNYLIQKENLIQKKRIEHFIKYSSDGIHILDLSGNVIECSESFANLIGYTVPEVMNLNVKDWDAFIPIDELITVIKDISNQKKIFETKYRKKDGSIIDVQINAVGIYLENTTYLYASSRDITEKKELINAIEDEKRFITTLVNSQEQIVITTNKIELKSVNNSFLDFFNVKNIEEFVNIYGNCICDSFDKDDTNGFIQKNMDSEEWTDYINTRKESIHKAKIIKDNKTYIFSITVDKFLFKNEQLYTAVFSDITQLENSIKINEETNFFLTQLLNSIPDPIFYKNELGIFTGFNKAYEKTFNVNKEDLIGKTVLDLEYLPYEDRVMYHSEDMNTIENLSSLKKEQDMIFADNKIHTTLYSVNSYTKRNNSPGGLIGIFTDITEMREKDKLIFEQAKLASMGEMIGNIAHQWRQPLSVITSIASGTNIRNEFGTLDLDILTKDMDLIIYQSQYLSKTIDDFRSFTKINNVKTIFSINDALQQTLSLVTPAIKSHHINLITDFNDDLVIEGYQNELIQGFVNIINNARDAVNEKIEDNKDKFVFIETRKIGLNFEILIKDNGGGIPENIIHRIFEPYFTTKHKSVGTGIGLSMTYKILTEHHNSQIQVTNCEYKYNNQIYQGACFNIIFK